MRSSASSSGFFKRNGFNIYLYITCYAPLTIEDIKKANQNGLAIVAEDADEGVVKFIAPKIDEKYLLPFKRKLKDMESDFMMEKRI